MDGATRHAFPKDDFHHSNHTDNHSSSRGRKRGNSSQEDIEEDVEAEVRSDGDSKSGVNFARTRNGKRQKLGNGHVHARRRYQPKLGAAIPRKLGRRSKGSAPPRSRARSQPVATSQSGHGRSQLSHAANEFFKVPAPAPTSDNPYTQLENASPSTPHFHPTVKALYVGEPEFSDEEMPLDVGNIHRPGGRIDPALGVRTADDVLGDQPQPPGMCPETYTAPGPQPVRGSSVAPGVTRPSPFDTGHYHAPPTTKQPSERAELSPLETPPQQESPFTHERYTPAEPPEPRSGAARGEPLLAPHSLGMKESVGGVVRSLPSPFDAHHYRQVATVTFTPPEKRVVQQGASMPRPAHASSVAVSSSVTQPSPFNTGHYRAPTTTNLQPSQTVGPSHPELPLNVPLQQPSPFGRERYVPVEPPEPQSGAARGEPLLAPHRLAMKEPAGGVVRSPPSPFDAHHYRQVATVTFTPPEKRVVQQGASMPRPAHASSVAVSSSVTQPSPFNTGHYRAPTTTNLQPSQTVGPSHPELPLNVPLQQPSPFGRERYVPVEPPEPQSGAARGEPLLAPHRLAMKEPAGGVVRSPPSPFDAHHYRQVATVTFAPPEKRVAQQGASVPQAVQASSAAVAPNVPPPSPFNASRYSIPSGTTPATSRANPSNRDPQSNSSPRQPPGPSGLEFALVEVRELVQRVVTVEESSEKATGIDAQQPFSPFDPKYYARLGPVLHPVQAQSPGHRWPPKHKASRALVAGWPAHQQPGWGAVPFDTGNPVPDDLRLELQSDRSSDATNIPSDSDNDGGDGRGEAETDVMDIDRPSSALPAQPRSNRVEVSTDASSSNVSFPSTSGPRITNHIAQSLAGGPRPKPSPHRKQSLACGGSEILEEIEHLHKEGTKPFSCSDAARAFEMIFPTLLLARAAGGPAEASNTNKASLATPPNAPPRRFAPPPARDYTPAPRDSDLVILMRDIREHSLRIMGRPNNKAAFRSLPFTRILAFYHSRRPEDGPTVQDFALCHDLRALNGDNLAAALFYNERGAEVFAENFVAQGKYVCKDQPLIRKQFLIHLNGQLQNQYIGKKGTTETRRIGRRRARRNRRGETAEALANVTGMAAYPNVWKAIPYEACSGDESEYNDDNQKNLVITQLGWRNNEIRGWMQVWDDLNLKIQIMKKAGGLTGRLPYPRCDPEDRPGGRALLESHRYKAPSRLPRNFYSPDYLSDLTQVQLDSLDVQPPISLQFPPAIVSWNPLQNA